MRTAREDKVIFSSTAAMLGAPQSERFDVGVMAVIATGGAAAAICPLIGLATGMTTWNGDEAKRDRATFAVICDQQRKVNPALTCAYNDPKG